MGGGLRRTRSIETAHSGTAAAQPPPPLTPRVAGRGTGSPKATPSQSVFTLVNAVLGAGVLGFPYVYKSCGLAMATVLVAGVVLASAESMHLLLLAAQLMGQRSYEALAAAALGRRGAAAVDACVLVMNLGSLVAYLNILADTGTGVAGSVVPPGVEPSRDALLVGVTALVALPVTLGVRRPSLLAAVSQVSVTFLFFFGAATALTALSPAEPLTALRWWEPGGALLALPVVVYGFTAHQVLFSIYDALQSATVWRMTRVIHHSMGISTAMYITVGAAGYVAYGQSTAGDVLRNLGGVTLSPARRTFERALRVGYGLSILGTLPLVVLPLQAVLGRALGPAVSRVVIATTRFGARHAGPGTLAGRLLPRWTTRTEAVSETPGVETDKNVFQNSSFKVSGTEDYGNACAVHDTIPTLTRRATLGGTLPSDSIAPAANVVVDEQLAPEPGKPVFPCHQPSPLARRASRQGTPGVLGVEGLSAADVAAAVLCLGGACALAALVPNVELVFGLAGSTASLILAYILPGAVFLAASANEPGPGLQRRSSQSERMPPAATWPHPDDRVTPLTRDSWSPRSRNVAFNTAVSSTGDGVQIDTPASPVRDSRPATVLGRLLEVGDEAESRKDDPEFETETPTASARGQTPRSLPRQLRRRRRRAAIALVVVGVVGMLVCTHALLEEVAREARVARMARALVLGEGRAAAAAAAGARARSEAAHVTGVLAAATGLRVAAAAAGDAVDGLRAAQAAFVDATASASVTTSAAELRRRARDASAALQAVESVLGAAQNSLRAVATDLGLTLSMLRGNATAAQAMDSLLARGRPQGAAGAQGADEHVRGHAADTRRHHRMSFIAAAGLLHWGYTAENGGGVHKVAGNVTASDTSEVVATTTTSQSSSTATTEAARWLDAARDATVSALESAAREADTAAASLLAARMACEGARARADGARRLDDGPPLAAALTAARSATAAAAAQLATAGAGVAELEAQQAAALEKTLTELEAQQRAVRREHAARGAVDADVTTGTNDAGAETDAELRDAAVRLRGAATGGGTITRHDLPPLPKRIDQTGAGAGMTGQKSGGKTSRKVVLPDGTGNADSARGQAGELGRDETLPARNASSLAGLNFTAVSEAAAKAADELVRSAGQAAREAVKDSKQEEVNRAIQIAKHIANEQGSGAVAASDSQTSVINQATQQRTNATSAGDGGGT